MESEELIQYHQRRIKLLNKVIEGYLGLTELLNLELENINPGQTKEINRYLDSLKTVKQNIYIYGQIFRESEIFLDNAGVEIDYSWLAITREQWEETLEWEKKWIQPYLKKRNPIIHFFSSLFK